MARTFLVVGSGPAGIACATELRALDPQAEVVVAGRELDPPYERPPLSKGFLRGEQALGDFRLPVPEGVDLRLRTSVTKIAEGVASLQGGAEIAFDAACLATGAMIRRLRVEGSALEGIHYLRAPGNATAIRADAEAASSVVLVGGSFIACEVAASLTQMGKRCTLIMQEELPLSLACGETVGRWAGDLLTAHGVEWFGGDGLAGFEGAERVERVRTESGRAIDADMVVMGTGVVPDVMLARASGLELGETGGIRCSAALETSAAGVFAAGDACEFDGVRIEHWEVATAQGHCAARGMAGQPEPFTEVPYFWSDLADWATLESVGRISGFDEEEVRGDPASGSFAVLYRAAGELVAAVAVERPDDLEEARAALEDAPPQAAG